MKCSINSPALSLLMKHLVIGQRLKTPNFSAFHWSPHGSLVSIGQNFVTSRVVHLPKRTETSLTTESDQSGPNHQLLQLCTARTAWSESDQAVRAVHSCISWLFNRFKHFFFQISTFAYLENAEWQYDRGYVSTDVAPMCCPATSTTLVYFNFSFTRLRPFYVMNLLVPAMLLSACMVLTFLLPTNCGERLGYSMTILLSYTVLMTITSEMMPTTSKQTPYIGMTHR